MTRRKTRLEKRLIRIFKQLEKDPKLAEALLEEISGNSQYGIYQLNAEMTLKVWRETGELRIYQK